MLTIKERLNEIKIEFDLYSGINIADTRWLIETLEREMKLANDLKRTIELCYGNANRGEMGIIVLLTLEAIAKFDEARK